MRQFYIYKNHSGYYNAIFVDPVTGKKSVDKSTHTKDKFQATIIATQWFEHGVPAARPNSRKYYSSNGKSTLNLKDIAERISQEDAQTLITMLASKYKLSVPQQEATPLNVTPDEEVIIERPSAVTNPEIPLTDFLLNFWDYEKSEFIKRHLAHGHSMTKRHTDMMKGIVKNYWKPYFGDEVTVQQLDKATFVVSEPIQ